ncbi:MAG: hypothetical protein ACRD1B_03625 [Thermoanaerobaculia bacterium]
MTKRTTINLPDDVWKAAKIRAIEVGVDFQDLVSTSLQRQAQETQRVTSALLDNPALREIQRITRDITERANSFAQPLMQVVERAKEVYLSMPKPPPQIQQLLEATERLRTQIGSQTLERFRQDAEAIREISERVRRATSNGKPARKKRSQRPPEKKSSTGKGGKSGR